MQTREIERNKRRVVGCGGETDINFEDITTTWILLHPASPSSPLVSSVVGVPKLFWRYHLYAAQDLSICRYRWSQMFLDLGLQGMYAVISLPSLSSRIFLWCPNSKPSPLLGHGFVLFFKPSVLLLNSCCSGLSYGNILL